MKYVFHALTYRKHVLVCFQRFGAGLSFVSHKKERFSVCVCVCVNKLLSAILQENHVLVCVP